MARLARALEADCDVTRYDRRGYGEACPHLGPFTVQDSVNDLFKVMNDEPAVVFGHSFGGIVVLTAAFQRPELFPALAVYEAPFGWLSDWPGSTPQAREATSDPLNAAENFIKRMSGDAAWEGLSENSRKARRQEGLALSRELADNRVECRFVMSELTMEVVAAVGEFSSSHHQSAMATLASSVPMSRHVVIPGAHHMGPKTHPKEVAEAVILPLVKARS